MLITIPIMLPWTTGVEARESWTSLLPTQIVGMALLFASCFVVGPSLKKRGRISNWQGSGL